MTTEQDQVAVTQADRDAIADAVKPYADYHGDLPDYDDPLRPVYESGIQYAVELLAKELKVMDWHPCDGTEEFDGDLGGTLMNIVLAAMPKDEHGEPIYPCDLRTPAPSSSQGSEGEAHIVALALSKTTSVGQTYSMSQSWRIGGSRQDAIDQAILFAAKEKPGFGIWETLVTSVPLATPPTDAAIEESVRVEREACARLVANFGLALPPVEQRGTEMPEGVQIWGCAFDNRQSNQADIAAAIRARSTASAQGETA
ncbi:MAG: hypothetical protein M3Y22_18510 [Pseudomonadota bacterium]|nr:hypothetical protein [Pseudomonadota bacterium]